MSVQEKRLDDGTDTNCRCSSEENQDESGTVSCPGARAVLTPREEKVLGQIRTLHEEAKRLKARITEIEVAGSQDAAKLAQAREALVSLRRRRAELEQERLLAAEERMRALGHL